MQYRYSGGVQNVSVVLPSRVLDVTSGDVVDLTADEAARLDAHPDWAPATAEPVVELEALRRPELVELAAQAGLDTAGTRADLIERLGASATTTTPAPQEG